MRQQVVAFFLLLLVLIPEIPSLYAQGNGKRNGGGGGGGGNDAPATVSYDTIYLDEAIRDPSSVKLNTVDNELNWAHGLNNLNQVVGAVTYYIPDPDNPDWMMSSGSAACLWENGIVYDLNEMLGVDTQAEWYLDVANDLNDAGVIVGTGEVTVGGQVLLAGYLYLPGSDGEPPQVVWVTNENDEVNGPADYIAANPIAVNDYAEVVGTWNSGVYPRSSFFFNPATGDFVDLAPLMGLPEGSGVDVSDINNFRQIVGTVWSGTDSQGFRFDMLTGQLERIPPFKKSRKSDLGRARAINDFGTAVGSATTGNWSFEGFQLSPSGKMTSIGTLGGDSSYADEINADGVIAGRALGSSGPFRIVLYDDANGLREVIWEGSDLTKHATVDGFNDHKWILSRWPLGVLLVPSGL